MSRESAEYLDTEFSKLKAGAREVAPLVVQGDKQRAEEFLNKYFSDPNLEHALQGHFGDLFQALTYNREVKGGDNVLVGFKIKNGAELVMYSPLVMVLTGEHKNVSDYAIAKAMLSVFGSVNQGRGADGIVKGYLSLKHEARGDFSFGLAKDKMSIVLFCLLVSDAKIYGNFG
jgi:hypothetical protein